MVLQTDENGSHPVTSTQIRLATLIARIITATTLFVSIIILKVNRVTLENGYKLKYSHYDTYSYMLYISAIGLFYNFVQIPFAAFYFLRAKRLLNQYCFIQLDFYADKITSYLLATAIGAAFGATFELKKIEFIVDDSKLKSFFDMTYIPIVFFLVGFVSSAISSVLSSLALPRKL